MQGTDIQENATYRMLAVEHTLAPSARTVEHQVVLELVL
jgi:hypothetical protein